MQQEQVELENTFAVKARRFLRDSTMQGGSSLHIIRVKAGECSGEWVIVGSLMTRTVTGMEDRLRVAIPIRSPLVIGLAVGVAILIGIALLASRHATSPITGVGSLYYSYDDGKTMFAADGSNGAAFVKDGKVAVQAVVFTCDDNATRFIGYLKRVDANAVRQNPGYGNPTIAGDTYEVKRPGEPRWVPMRSPEGSRVLIVHGESGKGPPVQITP